jgi:HK97 family phage portal protein
MAKGELVGRVSTWQAIKAAVSMRFPGFRGSGYGGTNWLVNNTFSSLSAFLSRVSGTSINYAAEVGEPTLSSLVMAAVNWWGQTLPEPPLLVVEMDSEGKENPLPEHPALDVLRNPNPAYDIFSIWQAFACSWITRGNVYWLKGRNARGQVIQLWHVPPWMIRPRWPDDQQGGFQRPEGAKIQSPDFISYYEYDDGRDRVSILAEDILHFRNGLDSTLRYGMAPIEPVYREIYKDNEESNYGALLAKNGAVPPVVLSVKEDVQADPDDLRAYKERFQQSTQGDERGKVFVSNYPIDVNKLGFSPKEYDLRSAHRINEERFAAVIGIDAIVLGFGVGLESSTYNNTEQADTRTTRTFLVTRWARIESALTKHLGPDFGLKKNQRFAFDLTKVRTLQEDRDALFKRCTNAYMVGKWAKRSEVRAMAGLPTTPEDEVFYDEVKPEPQPMMPDGESMPGKEKDAAKSLQSFKRKPTTYEAEQMPAVAKAQDAARNSLSSVLSQIRARLIETGLTSLLELGDDYAGLSLELTASEDAALQSAIALAYWSGRTTVGETTVETKGLLDVASRIFKAVRAAILVKVVARIVDEYSRALLRGLDQPAALKQVEEILADEPAAYVEELASGAAYESVGGGRFDELRTMAQPGDRFIYSAILDSGTCPKCKADDLQEADDPAKLPHAPNPECAGRWRCRCSIVIARD